MATGKATWTRIGLVALSLFVMLAISAIFASVYERDVEFGAIERYPYQRYAVPLGIGGIISLVISIGAYAESKKS